MVSGVGASAPLPGLARGPPGHRQRMLSGARWPPWSQGPPKERPREAGVLGGQLYPRKKPYRARAQPRGAWCTGRGFLQASAPRQLGGGGLAAGPLAAQAAAGALKGEDGLPFADFCRSVWEDPGAAKGLELLEEWHSLDPNMLLMCIWLPMGVLGSPRPLAYQELSQFTCEAERWRLRVGRRVDGLAAVLEGNKGQSGPAAEAEAATLLGLVEQLQGEVDRVERAALAAAAEAVEWGEGGAGGSASASAWEVAVGNLRVYLEYGGLEPGEHDCRRLGDVLRVAVAGCTADEGELREALVPTRRRPRTLPAEERMRRYHRAKEDYERTKREWKQAQMELKERRRRCQRARYELSNSRKSVRQEFR